MGLFRLHLSFTERRRRRLAKKVDQLDRLEPRTAVAEPLSFTGLAIASIRGMLQLHFMYPDGANHALNALAHSKDSAKKAASPTAKPYALPSKLLKSIDALSVGQIAGTMGSNVDGVSGAG